MFFRVHFGPSGPDTYLQHCSSPLGPNEAGADIRGNLQFFFPYPFVLKQMGAYPFVLKQMGSGFCFPSLAGSLVSPKGEPFETGRYVGYYSTCVCAIGGRFQRGRNGLVPTAGAEEAETHFCPGGGSGAVICP